MIEIRDEQPVDIAGVREVNRRAFAQDQEANIVDALRANAAVLLSLVAIDSGRVVGHVLYSPLSIADVSGAALGPLAVRPDYQRTGIGTLLVEAGNRRLAQARCPFIVVVGHAEYYPRFGFTRASDYGVTCEFDVPDDVFMIFAVDRSKVPSGRAKYRHEFSTVK